MKSHIRNGIITAIIWVVIVAIPNGFLMYHNATYTSDLEDITKALNTQIHRHTSISKGFDVEVLGITEEANGDLTVLFHDTTVENSERFGDKAIFHSIPNDKYYLKFAYYTVAGEEYAIEKPGYHKLTKDIKSFIISNLLVGILFGLLISRLTRKKKQNV